MIAAFCLPACLLVCLYLSLLAVAFCRYSLVSRYHYQLMSSRDTSWLRLRPALHVVIISVTESRPFNCWLKARKQLSEYMSGRLRALDCRTLICAFEFVVVFDSVFCSADKLFISSFHCVPPCCCKHASVATLLYECCHFSRFGLLSVPYING
jgi:hypothetical protein